MSFNKRKSFWVHDMNMMAIIILKALHYFCSAQQSRSKVSKKVKLGLEHVIWTKLKNLIFAFISHIFILVFFLNSKNPSSNNATVQSSIQITKKHNRKVILFMFWKKKNCSFLLTDCTSSKCVLIFCVLFFTFFLSHSDK